MMEWSHSMLDLDRTMFFKAKFDVTEKNGEDALWAVIMSLKLWSIRKAKRDGYDIPEVTKVWTELKYGSKIDAPNASVKLFSCLHQKEDVYTWACQHTENECVTGYAPREWTTEIGFEGKTFDSGTISIITIYSDSPGFLGPLQDTPCPSIPALVKYIAQNDRLVCTVDGNPLELDAVEITFDNIEEYYLALSDERRELPVIVCSPSGDGKLSLDPSTIAKQLGPNALVLFTHKYEVMDAFNKLFPSSKLKCYDGMVRVYAAMPHFLESTDAYKHRFFLQHQIYNDGENYYYKILRRALAEDVHFWETSIRVDDVKRLNRQSKREKQARDEREAFQDAAINNVTNIVNEAEKRAKEAEAAFDDAADELKRCKEKLNEAEKKANTCEYALAMQHSSTLAQVLDEMPELNLTRIAHIFVEAYPERIDFSERGWKSLCECVTAPELFWYTLHSICTVLYPMFFSSGTEIAKAFNSRTRLTLSFKESEATERNASFMRQREDEYQGRRLFITPHIKSGNGDPSSPKFVHIYFSLDKETGRLVIGDTRHLDVSSTSKR